LADVDFIISDLEPVSTVNLSTVSCLRYYLSVFWGLTGICIIILISFKKRDYYLNFARIFTNNAKAFTELDSIMESLLEKIQVLDPEIRKQGMMV